MISSKKKIANQNLAMTSPVDISSLSLKFHYLFIFLCEKQNVHHHCFKSIIDNILSSYLFI